MRVHRRRHSVAVGATTVLVVAGIGVVWHQMDGFSAKSQSVDFARDIRPILNRNCLSCHGGVKQQGGVSFVYREQALGKGKSGRPTVVPGRPNASELISRVISTDTEVRMPYRAPPLPPQQIALLKQWIKEGAEWGEHWTFVTPKPQRVPMVKTVGWVRDPVDNFILARLEQERLTPSREADRSALLRRVSFDLTGLQPTPRELEAFLADTSPNAYEKQVDRLLASPHYGERWATLWLDLARYADSKGYQQDGQRSVWPYRDWVVGAFNRNLPYDQFVIKQLAGDLLPGATFEDRIATSFHRQTPANDEGGTDDEEFRVAAVVDRVSTTWSVLNGLTMNCVQCHSHPYDPIRHEEYYKSFAFFNNTSDEDAQFDEGPVLHVPKDGAQYRQAFQLQQQITALTEDLVSAGQRIAADEVQWKRLPITQAISNKTLGLERQWERFQRQGDALFSELGWGVVSLTPASRRQLFDLFLADTQINVAQAKQTALKHEVASFELRDGEALAITANIAPAVVSEFVATSELRVITALRVEILPQDPKIARHTPEEGFTIERTDAWVVHDDGRKEKIAFRSFEPDRNAHVASQLALMNAKVEGDRPGAPSLAEQLSRGGFEATKLFHARWIVGIPEAPLTLAPGSRIEVHLTQNNSLARVYASIKPTVARRVRLMTSSDPRWTELARDTKRASQIAHIEQLYRELAAIPTVPVPVMAEQPKSDRRQTLLFERGNFLAKIGAPLSPDVPALFPKLPAEASRDRLTMARWFFSPEQPLTARVAVNRFWEQLFGLGLVETLEDFGSVGEPPSHPELLDWLALHFQNDLKWDVKALLRDLVLSATYRQHAKTTPALLEKDPRNRLLARGPRQRLTAEMVRDQALAASGLLNGTVGGSPVIPALPPDVELTDAEPELKLTHAQGPDRYRRALYTLVKRAALDPSLITFDAAARDVSYARRIPTNTPLQALVTLNDAMHHEASVALAERLLKEPARALETRLSYGARLVLSRDPTAAEMVVLRTLYETALKDASAKRPAVVPASTATPPPRPSGRAELTAFTAVASALLNFDAALTR